MLRQFGVNYGSLTQNNVLEGQAFVLGQLAAQEHVRSYDKSLINSMDFQELSPEEWKAGPGDAGRTP